MRIYKEKFEKIIPSNILDAPWQCSDFVQKYISPEFHSKHEDYLDFVSRYYDVSIGDSTIPSTDKGYLFFSFYPIEDAFELDDPFKHDFFLIAKAEEEYKGENKNIRFYLSLSDERQGGIYYSDAREGEEEHYNFLCESFTDFVELVINQKGKIYHYIRSAQA